MNKLLFGLQFFFFFVFYVFCQVISPSKQMNYYLRNREDINERRRELYKLKRYKLSNPVPLNCNKDSSFQVKSIKQTQNIRSSLNQPLNLSLLCNSTPSHIVSFVDNEDWACKQLMEFVHTVIHPNTNSFSDMKRKLYRLGK